MPDMAQQCHTLPITSIKLSLMDFSNSRHEYSVILLFHSIRPGHRWTDAAD
jgi:hypothetical protein